MSGQRREVIIRFKGSIRVSAVKAPPPPIYNLQVYVLSWYFIGTCTQLVPTPPILLRFTSLCRDQSHELRNEVVEELIAEHESQRLA